MHRLIKHHTHTKQPSGIKYIDNPIDSPIPWNNIHPLSLKISGKVQQTQKILKDTVYLVIKLT